MENIWPNFHLDTENRILLCFWHRNQIIHWRNWRAALNSKVVSRLVHRRRFIGHFIFPTTNLMFWQRIFHSLSFVASNINLLHLFASKHCIHSDILWTNIGKLRHVPHKSFWSHLIQSIFGGVTKSESFGRICHKVRWPWPWPYIKEQDQSTGSWDDHKDLRSSDTVVLVSAFAHLRTAIGRKSGLWSQIGDQICHFFGHV